MTSTEGLKGLISEAVKNEFGVDCDPEFTLIENRSGDYATNIAYKLSSQLSKAPQTLATQLKGAIKHKDIAQIEAINGFLNITMNDSYWLLALDQLDKSFLSPREPQEKKVIVEFISANPTGPLTLANGRGGYSGDVLANVLSARGYQVHREYYINDAGNQIKQLGQSILGETDKDQAQYRGEYIKELRKEIMEPVSAASSEEVGQKAVELILDRYIRPAVKKMNITFDSWFSESQQLYADSGRKITEVLRRLDDNGLIKSREGAQWLALDGDKEGRVLVKKTGDYTYLLADIAYHWDKLRERGFDMAINLWGADHAGQVDDLKNTLQAMGVKQPLKIIVFQIVRLIRGGEEVKMSKRAGTYVAIEELFTEIEPDVVRWFFLSREFNTHMDFDLDLAKEQSQKNPFYYVMYAYVRAQSVLALAKSRGLQPATGAGKLTQLEKRITRQLMYLPELLESLSATYEVHKLTFYGTALAKLFHEYYEADKILDLPTTAAEGKLHILSKIVVAMDAYWGIMGITPRQEM